MNLKYFNGKSVFVTGHTGFKGAWLCQILKHAGASVTGYALAPENGALFEALSVSDGMNSIIGDIRDLGVLSLAFDFTQPEIVLHLAAQPLVLDSYERPAYTFDTNIIGTANLLECARRSGSVRSVVIVTTDKVYKNHEWVYGYREIDELGGSDPYSASKACAEIVAESYRISFLSKKEVPLSTTRAGNVIGGGDISANRIIPDCVRAAKRNEPITVRNPDSVRPYQHVLEPLFAYLYIAKKQLDEPAFAGSYNIGPDESDYCTTGLLVDTFCNAWGDGMYRKDIPMKNAPHETGLLKLDCSKMRSIFGWRPVWDVKTAVEKTVEWEKARHLGGNINEIIEKQIDEYMNCIRYEM